MRVQHTVGSRDDMQWSSYIKGQWVARVPTDHACRTTTVAHEMKRNEMDEMSVEEWWDEIFGRENERNSEKNLLRPRLSTTKPTWSVRDANSGTPAMGDVV